MILTPGMPRRLSYAWGRVVGSQLLSHAHGKFFNMEKFPKKIFQGGWVVITNLINQYFRYNQFSYSTKMILIIRKGGEKLSDLNN